MKNQFLTLCFLLSTTIVFAENPPESVVKELKQKFPSAKDVKWENRKYSDLWEASFKLKEKNAMAVFTQDGHWIYSTMEITLKEIAVYEVRAAIIKDYPECEIVSIIIINNLAEGTFYHVKAKCRGNIVESDYDYIGSPLPKIS